MEDDRPTKRPVSRILRKQSEVADSSSTLVGSFLREKRKLANTIKTLDTNRSLSMSTMDNQIHCFRKMVLNDQSLPQGLSVDDEISLSLIPEDGSNLSDVEELIDEDYSVQDNHDFIGRSKGKIFESASRDAIHDTNTGQHKNQSHPPRQESPILKLSHPSHLRRWSLKHEEKDIFARKGGISKSAPIETNVQSLHKSSTKPNGPVLSRNYASESHDKNIRKHPAKKHANMEVQREACAHRLVPKKHVSKEQSSIIYRRSTTNGSITQPARQRSYSDSQLTSMERSPQHIFVNNVNEFSKRDVKSPLTCKESSPHHVISLDVNDLIRRNTKSPACHYKSFDSQRAQSAKLKSNSNSPRVCSGVEFLPPQRMQRLAVNPMLFHPLFNTYCKPTIEEQDSNEFENLKKCRYLRIPQTYENSDVETF